MVGLQARLKTRSGFCDSVATKVRTGQLPQRVVDETFFWARQRAASIRNGHKYRPIVYFQPAMKARAKLLHLSLITADSNARRNVAGPLEREPLYLLIGGR